MTRVVGGVVAAGATAAVTTPSIVQQRSGLTDSDQGSSADRAGNGRGFVSRDNDSGNNRDCASRGRGSTTGNTDTDTGSSADQAGNGRTGYGRGRGSCAG